MATRTRAARSGANEVFAPRARARVPFEFVLDELAPLAPRTRPMFGCVAVYVGERLVFVLREKDKHVRDNGVWLATTTAHHDALRREFPPLRSVELLGARVTNWQNLPADAPDFESLVMRACELVRRGSPAIGTVPGARPRARPSAAPAPPSPSASPAPRKPPRGGAGNASAPARRKRAGSSRA